MQRIGLRSQSTAGAQEQENAGGIRGKAGAAPVRVARTALADARSNTLRGPVNRDVVGHNHKEQEGDVKKTGYGAMGQSRILPRNGGQTGKENPSTTAKANTSIFNKPSITARPGPSRPLTRQTASTSLRQASKGPELKATTEPAAPPSPDDVDMPSPAKETESPAMEEVTEDRGSVQSYSSAMIPDIDEGDDEDPQLASRYAADIYKYLRHTEKQYGVSAEFLARKVVTPRMRGILVDWLHQVHIRFHLLPETMYMTVQIIDRYLAKELVAKDDLQLVGVTGMLLAAKYEEMYAPEINDFVYITDDTYTAKQILAMEIKMLNALGCNLGRPLPIHFLRRFSKAAEADSSTHTMAKYMMELALCEYTLASVMPSYVAGAALLLTTALIKASESNVSPDKVIQGLWTPTLHHYSGLRQDEHLLPVLRIMAKLLLKVHTGKSKMQAVRAKFSNPKYFAIATHDALTPEALKSLADE